jgi:hypothetical protein
MASYDYLLFVLVPAGAVVVASFFDPANIGLRRILPAFGAVDGRPQRV